MLTFFAMARVERALASSEKSTFCILLPDFIVPSDMPGVGRSAKEGESTVNSVGRALSTDTNENVRRIRILVWR
jgi:hypothetical protein